MNYLAAVFEIEIDPPLLADIDRWLAEDLGSGDLTAEALIPPGLAARGVIMAKAPGVLAGRALIAAVYGRVGPRVSVDLLAADGERLESGRPVARLAGEARAILAGERVVLNLLSRLCGIATRVAQFREAAGRSDLVLLDTRKTTPGLRRLEKYAVRCGGGTNHRAGLYDAVLVKENHFLAVGAKGDPERFRAAVRAAHRGGHDRPVEIEVESLDELLWAIEAGARRILLDNMAPPQLAECVARARALAPEVVLEASGGVSLDTVAAIAATGVHRTSVGAFTHSAPALDLSLRLEPVEPRL